MDKEDIYKIIEKNELQQAEVESVVEEYIYEKKGRRVKINIKNHPIVKMVPNPSMALPILERELSLLNTAYEIACEYFFEQKRKENEKQD